MADERPVKRARVADGMSEAPLITLDLVVGPLACILLLERDPALPALLQTCRFCASNIPTSLIPAVFSMRRAYPCAGLGVNVFRVALRAKRPADDLEHIIAVFGACVLEGLMDWLSQQSDAVCLLRVLRLLRLNHPAIFASTFNAFEHRPDLFEALFEDLLMMGGFMERDAVTALIINYGLPQWARPFLLRFLEGRRALDIDVGTDRFRYFLHHAPDDEFNWMIEHCPVVGTLTPSDIAEPVAPRLLEILRRYPYAVLCHFRAERRLIANPGYAAPVLCPLLFLDNPSVTQHILTGECRLDTLRALKFAGIDVSVDRMVASAVPPDEVLEEDVITADDRVVSDFIRLLAHTTEHHRVPTLAKALYAILKRHAT